MDVFSTSPSCTQVLLQLDSLPNATADNFPTGRHSRYMAFTTTTNEWERLEFTALDLPDPMMNLTENPITSIALFFAPGTYTAHTYSFKSLDSATSGCETLGTPETCEEIVPKSCRALFEGENCTNDIDDDNDGLVDCADMDCILDMTCTALLEGSLTSVSMRLETASSAPSNGAMAVMLSVVIMGMMGVATML